MAKKPAKKTAKKSARKPRKAVAKKTVAKPAIGEKPVTAVAVSSAKAIDAPVRLNRDEKNALRKQLQADLRAEKNPVKRNAMRREAAPLLKY